MAKPVGREIMAVPIALVLLAVLGSDDPIEAADDALREFPADELVFATHSERSRPGWSRTS